MKKLSVIFLMLLSFSAFAKPKEDLLMTVNAY